MTDREGARETDSVARSERSQTTMTTTLKRMGVFHVDDLRISTNRLDLIRQTKEYLEQNYETARFIRTARATQEECDNWNLGALDGQPFPTEDSGVLVFEVEVQERP